MSRRIYYSLIFFALMLAGCANNHQIKSPSIVEVVDMDYRFSNDALLKFCQENDIEKSSVYQWQNHWVIYTDQKHATTIASNLGKDFPRLKINLYEKPFYNFNREAYSHEKPAKKWTNIIMTADLVADTTMQKQYLAYHRTQFEKWPQVAKGFYNADFQQVLVFKNGRQLMLVISIPDGKTLDELNPKTSENNPRVDDWNHMMSKYQTGIEEAPKGTVWVTFSAIH